MSDTQKTLTASNKATPVIAVNAFILHDDDSIRITSIKGRWVTLASGKNISRAEAQAGSDAYYEAAAKAGFEYRDASRREEDASLTTTDLSAEASKQYTGPMLALRERVKAGTYKKAANGRPSCGDELAQALGVLQPAQVIRACMIALAYDANPYTHLNIGQQSMNLRNRVRNALTHGVFGMGVVTEAVEEVQEMTA